MDFNGMKWSENHKQRKTTYEHIYTPHTMP